MSKEILDAIKYADLKHSGQHRKGSGDPYVSHPVAASYLVVAHKRSKYLKELIQASLLHDVLEDTDATFEELVALFGPLVASLVLELTNDKKEIERVGKLQYQCNKLAGISSYGLIVKLADRMHNVSDNPTHQMVVDTLTLMNHICKARKLTKTQKTMVFEIRRLCAAALEENREHMLAAAGMK